jgi:hypothetical protein
MVIQEKEARQRRFIAVATLMAHMTGFAVINVGGGLQHLDFFLERPMMMFAVPFIMLIFLIIACRLVRRIRLTVIHRLLQKQGMDGHYEKLVNIHDDQDIMHKETGIRWCLDKWDEECYDAENEISGLAVSFLLLQAMRYNLTGVMPNNMGIEEEHYLHPESAVGFLASFMACFVVSFVLLQFVFGYIGKQHAVPGSCQAFMRRMFFIAKQTMAMGFAWALMYVAKWQLSALFPTINPNDLVARVILALLISFLCICLIIMLDFLADMDFTGEDTDTAIRGVLDALCVLVGFCWEQSFDGAVEVLSESYFKEHIIIAEVCLTAGVFIIVYPIWRKYILSTLLKLQYMCEHGTEEPPPKTRSSVSDLGRLHHQHSAFSIAMEPGEHNQ